MTNKEKFSLKANIIFYKVAQALGAFSIGLSIGVLAFTLEVLAIALLVVSTIVTVIMSISIPKAQADYNDYIATSVDADWFFSEQEL